MFTLHCYSTLVFFHLSKFYLDGKTSLLKQCFSYFNCRLLGIIGLWLNIYIGLLARPPGDPRKYLTAKGVRSHKSLGTAAPNLSCPALLMCACMIQVTDVSEGICIRL